jgi:hypothetical protein
MRADAGFRIGKMSQSHRTVQGGSKAKMPSSAVTPLPWCRNPTVQIRVSDAARAKIDLFCSQEILTLMAKVAEQLRFEMSQSHRTERGSSKGKLYAVDGYRVSKKS